MAKLIRQIFIREDSQRGFLKVAKDGPGEVIGDHRMGLSINEYYGHFSLETFGTKVRKGPRKAKREVGYRYNMELNDEEAEWLMNTLKQYVSERRKRKRA